MVIDLLFDIKEDACFLWFYGTPVQIYSNSADFSIFRQGNRTKISIKICFVA